MLLPGAVHGRLHPRRQPPRAAAARAATAAGGEGVERLRDCAGGGKGSPPPSRPPSLPRMPPLPYCSPLTCLLISYILFPLLCEPDILTKVIIVLFSLFVILPTIPKLVSNCSARLKRKCSRKVGALYHNIKRNDGRQTVFRLAPLAVAEDSDGVD